MTLLVFNTFRRSSISTMIQQASAFCGDDLQRLKTERLKTEQAQAAAGEDLQWATAAMLTREELAEKLSAITAKASAIQTTASTFYLEVEPSELFGSPGQCPGQRRQQRPATAPCAAMPNAATEASTDPFAEMAREMGVKLQSPQEVRECRQVQERSRQLERQQSLRVEIEDTLTPRKASLAGSPSTTRSYLYRATRIEQDCNMLRASASSPGCVELQASYFDGHASKPRLLSLPPRPPHQTPHQTPRPRSARPSPSSSAIGLLVVRPATSGGEGCSQRSSCQAGAAAKGKAQWPPPRAVRGRWSHIASGTAPPLSSSDSSPAVCACAWGDGSEAAHPAAALGRRNSARRSSLGGESPLARRPTITCVPPGDTAPQGHPAAALGRRNSARRASVGGESPLARRPTTIASPDACSGADPGAGQGAGGWSSADRVETSPPQQHPYGNACDTGAAAMAGATAALRRRSACGTAARRGSVGSARPVESMGLDERLSAGLALPGCSRPEAAAPGPDGAAALQRDRDPLAPVPLASALKSAGLIARCGRLSLARLEPLLRLVAPQLFRPPNSSEAGGGDTR